VDLVYFTLLVEVEVVELQPMEGVLSVETEVLEVDLLLLQIVVAVVVVGDMLAVLLVLVVVAVTVLSLLGI
jgi:hypothetical protein